MAEPKKDPKSGSGKPAVRPRLVISPNVNAVYSNVVRIVHSPSEMVFDFAQSMPGEPNVPIKARVMMSPLSAKLLQRALAENIAKFESKFGEISVPQGKSLADDLFRNMPPPEPPQPEEGK